MQAILRWIRRLGLLLRRERVKREMDEELRFHLDMETRSNLEAGMGAREARRQALLAFGGVDRFRERSREARGFRTLEDFAADLRVTFRGLRKSPSFTLLAILSLALGIGANTAIFSVVNALFIRQLPFEAADELVTIYRESEWTRYGPLSYPDFLEVQRATTGVFSGLGGAWVAFVQRETGDGAETLVCELVTGNYFQLLGIGTRFGRTISPEDHVAPGAHPVVVLGYRFWQEAFGGDPQVVGRTIRLSGGAFRVVGVMEEDFKGSLAGVDVDVFAPVMMVDFLQPLMENSLDSRGASAFRPMGRLSPGVNLAQTNVALERVAARLKEDFPEIWQPTDSLYGLAVDRVLVNPDADRTIVAGNLLAMGLVAMVLLIACANLASFLLARAVEQRREIAVRKALGASRGRLVRQALTETLALAVVGGGVGILFALWLQELALGITLPLPVTLGFDLSLDWRVLFYTLGVTIATGVLVGVLPALEATGREISPVLKDESAAAGRPRAVLLSRILVTGQVAVSVVLLATAGLFLRSFEAARRLDPGFGTEPTALVSFMIPVGEFSEDEGRLLLDQLENEVRSLQGVERVGIISNPHLNTVNTMILDVNAGGIQPPLGRSAHTVDFTSVDGAFFAAAGIDFLEGRTFSSGDVADGLPVAIVNETMARNFWPDQSPLGQVVTVEAPGFPDVTVVGVVRTAKIHSLAEPPTPFLYLPFSQEYNAWVTVLAVTRGDPAGTTQRMYRTIREEHPRVVITATKTMEEHIGVMLILQRLSATLSGLFAVVALGLAIMGLYGVVSYAVARRRREMGVRLSLGAAPRSLVALQVLDGMKLVALGGALGLVASAGVCTGLSGFLFGVRPLDPVTFGGVGLLLLCVAMVAAFLPARKAGRVDPMEVLRRE